MYVLLKYTLYLTPDQVALQNGIDYATIIAQIKEARSRGLTAPVLLMGTTLIPSIIASAEQVT